MAQADKRNYLSQLKERRGSLVSRQHAATLLVVNLDKFYQSAPGVLMAEASMLRWPAGKWPRMFLLEGLASGPQMVVYKRMDENGAVQVYTTLNYELRILND